MLLRAVKPATTTVPITPLEKIKILPPLPPPDDDEVASSNHPSLAANEVTKYFAASGFKKLTEITEKMPLQAMKPSTTASPIIPLEKIQPALPPPNDDGAAPQNLPSNEGEYVGRVSRTASENSFSRYCSRQLFCHTGICRECKVPKDSHRSHSDAPCATDRSKTRDPGCMPYNCGPRESFRPRNRNAAPHRVGRQRQKRFAPIYPRRI
ncbi:hypothetical protein Peur_038540 [Populus x canadensis]